METDKYFRKGEEANSMDVILPSYDAMDMVA